MKAKEFLVIRVSIDGKFCDNVFPQLDETSADESFAALFEAIQAEISTRQVPHDFPANTVILYGRGFEHVKSYRARLSVEELNKLRTTIASRFYTREYLEDCLKMAQKAVEQLAYLNQVWQPFNPAPVFEVSDE